MHQSAPLSVSLSSCQRTLDTQTLTGLNFLAVAVGVSTVYTLHRAVPLPDEPMPFS